MDMKLKILEDFKYIAKDKNGNIFFHEAIPCLTNTQWKNKDGYSVSITNLIHLPMSWDKSLHKLIRDKGGFLVDLEPYTPDSREELKVDDKVWVWNEKGEDKRPRHFSSYREDERGIYAFASGGTSFTSKSCYFYWRYWEKA